MLNQRLAGVGRGERSPTEIGPVRYADMRAALIGNYCENKIGEVVEEKGEGGGVTTYVKGTGMRELDSWFQGRRLNQIDTDLLRAYRKDRLDSMCKKDEASVIEGESPEQRAKRLRRKRQQHDTTINRSLALLRRMMNLTVQERCPEVPEAGNARKGFVEPAKFEELLGEMPEALRPYLLFFYETGCRPKAARAIVWDWVSLDEGMIYIPDNTTKNDEYLPCPMSRELVAMLRKKFRSGPVFDTTNFCKAFLAACVKVWLGRKTGPERWQYGRLIPYDLRRGAVRKLIRAGVPESVAMKISGHKTRHVFDRYNITSVEDVKQAMEKVARRNARLSGNTSSMQPGAKRRRS